MSPDDDPSVAAVYDRIAESYAERYWEDNPHQAYLEFPGTTGLIPDVEGKRILDAGCGSGVYAEWLLERGADVVGVDASEAMLEQAEELVGDRAQLHRVDLSEGLAFADDDAFDGVVSGSVLDHVEDWRAPISEFARVVTPGGFLVFSVRHPLENARTYEDWTYFEVESRIEDWGVETPHYPRPFSAILTPLLDTGFRIDGVAEPRPTEEFADRWPDEYDEAARRPHFLSLRAISE